ncbi:MAG: hypothetical protein OXI66_14675, partial [Boseongicola sp.]|nr:hypothetical protein [Boseongicola sp.]
CVQSTRHDLGVTVNRRSESPTTCYAPSGRSRNPEMHGKPNEHLSGSSVAGQPDLKQAPGGSSCAERSLQHMY